MIEKLGNLRDHLTHGLVERDVEVQAALLALVAGEHILLIGEPGTAKSMVARRLTSALAGANCFERLLTRFTTPDELFGPFSIKGLENDEYRRLVDGYLPTASVVFLDEIFKANSAILNALLTLLNERVFHNGMDRQKTPLKAVVAASNEVPEEGELDALFDRFLLRLHVSSVSDDGFDDLLTAEVDEHYTVPAELQLTDADLAAIREASASVTLPDDVRAVLRQLRTWCAEQQLRVSDRRWRKIVALLKTAAATNGRTAVLPLDCLLLEHCLVDLRTETTSVNDKIADLLFGHSNEVEKLTQLVLALEKAPRGQEHARDDNGRLLYLDRDGRPTHDPGLSVQKVVAGEPQYRFDNTVFEELNADRDRRSLPKLQWWLSREIIAFPKSQLALGWPRPAVDRYIQDPRTHVYKTVKNKPLLRDRTPKDAVDARLRVQTYLRSLTALHDTRCEFRKFWRVFSGNYGGF